MCVSFLFVDIMEQMRTLNVKSELNLEKIDSDSILVKNPFLPDELNELLRKQLFSISQENRKIQNELKEKAILLEKSQMKIDEITTKFKEYKRKYSSDPIVCLQSITNQKINELEKRLEEKTNEITELNRKLQEATNENDASPKSPDPPIENADAATPPFSVNQLNKLQDKLNQTAKKLWDSKNLNMQLKHDLKLSKKLLQQEIGDHFNTNWRGRAQIICDLQQKNRELREKLRLCHDNPEKRLNLAPPIRESASTSTTYSSVKKCEALSRENHALKTELEELRKRYDGSKARGKLLENDNSAMHRRMGDLNGKIDENQMKILKLQNQLTSRNESIQLELGEKTELIRKLEEKLDEKQYEIDKIQCILENFKQKNVDVKLDNAESKDLAHRIDTLELERGKLLEHLDIQNGRLCKERDNAAKIQKQLRVEQQKCAKLEANLARLALERNGGHGASYTNLGSKMANSDESTCKNRLELAEEHLKTMQSRLAVEIYEKMNDFRKFAEILKNCECLKSD